MIRIYLDWNVISNLKKPEYAEIAQFTRENKEYLQFPYSPVHFNDLMKSYSPQNEYFFKDLETLQYLSEKHLLRWEDDRTMPLFVTPREYFEGEKGKEDAVLLMDMDRILSDLDKASQDYGIGKVGDLLKSLYKSVPCGIEINAENKGILQNMFPNINPNSSMWDMIKDMAPFSKRLLRDRDYYRNLRRTIGEGGFKVDVNSGNWNEEVVFERINTFLTKMHAGKTFFQYVEMISNHQKRPINRHRFFTTAYLLLDMIGYKSDKLPKPTDNMQNIYNDAEHAFYGAHCDFFVASDRNLLTKARVLYRELNISTVVMSPQNYIVSLESVIHKLPRSAPELFQDVIKHIEQNNVVESYPDEEIETYVVKLPVFYLNFFNYVIYQSFKDQNLICFTCKRVFKNYSDFGSCIYSLYCL